LVVDIGKRELHIERTSPTEPNKVWVVPEPTISKEEIPLKQVYGQGTIQQVCPTEM